jgi:hypothetical protein
MARFDQPVGVIESHIRDLADAVVALNPAVVYLDPGDPAAALGKAASERPAEWLESVIAYHCSQGYGRARGLSGFEGYVEFMRRRREVELAILPRLGVPALRVEVGDGDWATHRSEVTDFLDRHLNQGFHAVPMGA